MTEKKGNVLQALRDTLQFHNEMGIAEYPDSKDIQRFFDITGKTERHAPVAQPVKRGEIREPSVNIESLEDDIKACTLCQLSDNSSGRVIGKGKIGSRLMIVGDYSYQSGSFSSDILFGGEEDEMLWKMMTAIGMVPEMVYVTNCLKCCPVDPGTIDGKCEERCFSFLSWEIGAVAPQMIIAMGDVAARVITGQKDPLVRLRGRFGMYRYPSGQDVPVMPTFHPRFLLEQQDMKKATWNDLQAVKRRLDAL